MQYILDLFYKALEDHHLSKDEIKLLARVLKENLTEKEDIGFIRNRLFEYARKSLSHNNPEHIFHWLEKVNKMLLTHLYSELESIQNHAYFSPIDDCTDVIRKFIRKTEYQLDICVFTISDDLLTEEILIAHQKGIKVRIISDNEKIDDIGSDVQYLRNKGILVKVDQATSHMHHKFALSDQNTLLTGSYNWTKAAALYNQENILVTNQPGLISSYQKEFQRLWDKMSVLEETS